MIPGLSELQGVRVFTCSAEGVPLQSGRDAVELIADAASHGADCIVIPVERFGPGFFHLRTGLAGEFLQKFVTYQIRVVILGDISARVQQSTALRDFIHESNQGKAIWFAADFAEFEARIRH